jgi:hypothetical protein
MAEKTTPTPTVKTDSPINTEINAPIEPVQTLSLSEFCNSAVANGSSRLLVQLFANHADKQGLVVDTLDNFTLAFNQFSNQPVRS